MGLAGPRNRTKISSDPRNTTWANSTSRFGHRILTTLGWTPGSTLGDTASTYHQSGHITEASQAGVKIVLKDDNLGIGCNKRAREDECVGLDGLQDLLGRLNGKDEDRLNKEAGSREKMRREVIVGERYGMRFVRGETYVSSDIETLMKRIKKEEEEDEAEEAGKNKIKKKIKKEENSEADIVMLPDGSSSVKIKKEKKGKKVEREKSSSKSASATTALSDESSKKRKRSEGDDSESKEKRGIKPKMSKKSKNGETREERKARREKEKREKEARKAEKRKKKAKSSSLDSSDSSDDEESTAPSGTATPSIPAALVGRQAIRHRYINAKRSAIMDAKSLNEIFMIKA